MQRAKDLYLEEILKREHEREREQAYHEILPVLEEKGIENPRDFFEKWWALP